MKIIKDESFEIQRQEDAPRVCFKGALRLSGAADYTPILELLMGLLEDTQRPIVLDLRDLEFLNSSGITMFSRFVIAARDRDDARLEFIASEKNPWHARSLKNLQRLMPELVVRLM
ncbi:MAG TPA: hypothetical protein VHC90_18330 [Bryobacteraceae bacterium]|nr:hypothetical protein [Bryobacteraceae bacterium]